MIAKLVVSGPRWYNFAELGYDIAKKTGCRFVRVEEVDKGFLTRTIKLVFSGELEDLKRLKDIHID